MAALWATHLIDEVEATGRVIVLHQGRVLAQGVVPEVIANTGAPSMRAAFDALTQGACHEARCITCAASPASSTRGLALPEPARPLPLGAGAAAGLAAIFAAGFRFVLGVSIIPPYETYVPYEVYIAPGLIGMIQLFQGMQSSLSMVYDREMGSMRRCW